MAALRVAPVDQLARDPAQRIGMIATVRTGRPIGFLRGDCGADGLFVAHVAACELEVDRGKARLFGQCLADGHRIFPVRAEFGPDVDHPLFVGEQAARHGDGAGHSRKPLGERIDKRDIVAPPFLRPALRAPASLKVHHAVTAIDDGAGSPECGLSLDGGGKSMGHGLETGRHIASRPIANTGQVRSLFERPTVRLVHKRPQFRSATRPPPAALQGVAKNG